MDSLKQRKDILQACILKHLTNMLCTLCKRARGQRKLFKVPESDPIVGFRLMCDAPSRSLRKNSTTSSMHWKHRERPADVHGRTCKRSGGYCKISQGGGVAATDQEDRLGRVLK